MLQVNGNFVSLSYIAKPGVSLASDVNQDRVQQKSY